MRSWRKSTWALLIWTVIGVLWLYTGWSAVAEGGTSDAEAVGGAIGSMVVIFFWFLGFVVLSIIWFASRPARNVEVYSPEGAKVYTSEKEAKRLVNKSGYSYQYQPPQAATATTEAREAQK